MCAFKPASRWYDSVITVTLLSLLGSFCVSGEDVVAPMHGWPKVDVEYLLHFWRRFSHWTWDSFIHLGWQARKPQASVCPTSSALRLQMHASVFSFYMNGRNPDSGTHTDMANISPTKSAPAPSFNSILENDLYMICKYVAYSLNRGWF